MLSISGQTEFSSRRCVQVNGPVVVGAGPLGLAVSACLKEQCVPHVVIERADCIASLWQKRTYDRLKRHLPKKFCQLPKLPFSEDYPEYPTKKQFIAYLENYAQKFDIKPQFNECVQSAKYDETCQLWRVITVSTNGLARTETEYVCQMLVVATGENAKGVIPEIDGLEEFSGEVIHAKDYKSGETYTGKKVLVVGYGNSGMEASLYLSNSNAKPSMVVRSSVHVMPQQTMGKSTFDLAMMLMEWLPLGLDEPVVAETSGTGNLIEQASLDIIESPCDTSLIDGNEDESFEFEGELELTAFINSENQDSVPTAVRQQITRPHYLNPKEIAFLLGGYVAFVGIVLWAKNIDFSTTNPFMSISVITYLMANLNLCVLAWMYGRLENSNSPRQKVYLRCYMILENFYFILCFVTFVSPIPLVFTSHYKPQTQAHPHRYARHHHNH